MDEVNVPSDTILTLPAGMNAADIARACREAAMEVINHSNGWGKAELGMWLTGSYAPLTAHASKAMQTEEPAAVWPVPLLRDIDARLVERILQAARTEVIDTLMSIAKDGSASFVLRALIAGSVARCEDDLGEPAWAPTGAATRLADRVLSLFAVDYLHSGEEYEVALYVCATCQSVAFDVGQRTVGSCLLHGTAFTIAAPRRQATLPYPPQRA